jgi:autophagy-related protein 33
LRPERTKTITSAKQQRTREKKGKMEASYEVLGDSHSEGTSASDEGEEDVNGEEVRSAMEGFKLSQLVRTGLSAVAFAMSLVGLWGDGA